MKSRRNSTYPLMADNSNLTANSVETVGELVTVALAKNQAEAEFIQALLMEEGIPSMLKRTRGFDVPDFLAAGPRDVMVASSVAQVANEILLQAGLKGSSSYEARETTNTSMVKGPLIAATAVLAVSALAALIAWLST